MTDSTGSGCRIELQWAVIVREWRSGSGEHEMDIGTEIEIVSAPDRAMAIIAAMQMIRRHGSRATSGIELEVSIAAPALERSCAGESG